MFEHDSQVSIAKDVRFCDESMKIGILPSFWYADLKKKQEASSISPPSCRK